MSTRLFMWLAVLGVVAAGVAAESEVNCSEVECPPELPACPADSYRLPAVVNRHGCCSTSPGCSCLPAPCPHAPKCPPGRILRSVSQATGKPGSCCPVYECVAGADDDEKLACTVHGEHFPHGSTWQKDRCSQCQCRNGLSFCETTKCSTMPHCTVVQVPEGECCPVCIGCQSPSGVVYNNSARWMEDPCTSCTCNDGQLECETSLCKTTCLKPRHVEGECCPVCDEDACDVICEFGYEEDKDGNPYCRCKARPVTSALDCPPFVGCHKNCSYGYRKNRDGCEVCKCNKCKVLTNCRKNCLHGYATNDKGCPICKCKEVYDVEYDVDEGIEHIHAERICLSLDGKKHDEGEMWSDGCRVCYCHGGSEMCTLITCPVPKCKSPIIHHDECCPRCPEEHHTAVQPNVTVCHSVDGEYRVEGETWFLAPCTRCLCHHGQVLCDTQQCPPAPCPNSHLRSGDCCPYCPYFRMTEKPLPSTDAKATCYDPDREYVDGDMWRVGACRSCMCSNGNVTCYDEKCPPADCARPVLRKNQCCPVCLDHNPSRTCTHSNATYALGEKWVVDECTHCICQQGNTKCTTKICASSCPEPVKIPGRCCPVCPETKLTKIHVTSKTGDYDSNERDESNTVSDVSYVEPTSSVKMDSFCIVLIVVVALLLLAGTAICAVRLCRKRCRQKLLVMNPDAAFAFGASYTTYQPPLTSYKDPKSKGNEYYYKRCSNGTKVTAVAEKPLSQV